MIDAIQAPLHPDSGNFATVGENLNAFEDKTHLRPSRGGIIAADGPFSQSRRVGGHRVNDDVRHQMVALLPRLRRFAFVLTRDMERADDLVQETCVRALDRIGQWERGTRLDSWLYRIAQNIWFDRLRAAKVRGETAEMDAAAELVGEDGRVVVDAKLALGDISRAIAKLPEEQQVLIALVCIDGLSYKEAASILQVPIGTVMSRLARARQALHADLGGMWHDEPES